ncbi:MAG: hypothetical protein Pg6C_18310 [Treponemataceae bacterium]|nr:MAG: hypothetical protein Pg6C_18310 [Treponemataceae bacterium]
MKGEIDRDFCSYDYSGIGRCANGNTAVYCEGNAIEERNKNCKRERCGYYHRKWPTPEQFKEEYGKEWDGAVYVKQPCRQDFRSNGSGRCGWIISGSVPRSFPVVCACTPYGAPDIDWTPLDWKLPVYESTEERLSRLSGVNT